MRPERYKTKIEIELEQRKLDLPDTDGHIIVAYASNAIHPRNNMDPSHDLKIYDDNPNIYLDVS
jgi:hypothetical protein